MSQRWVAIFACFAPLMFGQQGKVQGPVAGYVFDSGAHAVRPILGIPGASILGDPVDLGFSAIRAAVSPAQEAVLAIAADGSLHAFQLSAGAASEVAVNGFSVAPERIVFSPSGSAAAVYGGGRIQVMTGIGSSPHAGSTFDISALLVLPGNRGHQTLSGSFAVSDDGAYVLVAGGSGVQVFGGGSPRQVASGSGMAVAFARGNHDAIVAGTGVTLIHDVGGAANAQSIAEEGAIPATVGAAFSSDNSKLYLASAAARGVTGFDLAAGTSQTISCDCAPAGIQAMGNFFRLNEVSADPLWLLDTTVTGPRIVFVPAKASE